MTLLSQPFNSASVSPTQDEVNSFVKAICMGPNTPLVIEMLTTYGSAIIDEKADNGNTAVLGAADSGRTGLMLLLLDYNPNLEVRDTDGNTALILAAWGGHKHIVQFLLESGADINAKNNFDESARLWTSIEDIKALLQEWPEKKQKIISQNLVELKTGIGQHMKTTGRLALRKPLSGNTP